jgi:hypothetical protein
MALSACRLLSPVQEYSWSTVPPASCLGVPRYSAPAGKSTSVSWTGCSTPPTQARGTTRWGRGPAPPPRAAHGLAAVVTAAVPPEQASAWRGRWMGHLRWPRPVKRRSRRRKHLRGSGSEPPGFSRGSLRLGPARTARFIRPSDGPRAQCCPFHHSANVAARGARLRSVSGTSQTPRRPPTGSCAPSA